MANVNNPVIGTTVCYNPGCDEVASVHQIQKGSREGELYTRCPECKCNQSTGRPFQKYLAENAEFREGFEHLAIKHQVPETEQDESLETEATEAEETEQLLPEEKKGKAGLAVVGLVTLVIGLALRIKK